MGELIDLNPKSAIADSDIPQSIARDTEITAAINEHLQAVDHTQSGVGGISSGLWTPILTYTTPGTMVATYARATVDIKKMEIG